MVSPCALLPVNKATSSTPLSINIPRFYFPKGLPNVCTNHEEIIARIEEAFTEFEDEKANICEMGKIAKVTAPWVSLLFGEGERMNLKLLKHFFFSFSSEKEPVLFCSEGFLFFLLNEEDKNNLS